MSIPPSTPADPVRVAVLADQGLVAESVRAALQNRGHDAVVVHWPTQPVDTQLRGRRRQRRAAGPPPDVALLLSDLDTTESVRTARSLVAGLDVPWLVLTAVPRGPAWGAMYDAGADLVVSARTRLDVTTALLEELAAGRTPRSDRRRRSELIRAWRTFARQRDELTARLDTLTEREDEVLRTLYEGMTVRAIAEQAGVTESTVRSQVKAILRKLDVSSQIAAVALFEEIESDSSESDSSSESP